MLVAVLRRGSRATTARECAHLTGSWSKDVHINPSSTFAERTLSGVDDFAPPPPTRRCRSSSSSVTAVRSPLLLGGVVDRWIAWCSPRSASDHRAAETRSRSACVLILANVGNHLEKLDPIHASFALNLLGKDASRNRKGQLRDLLRNDGAFAGFCSSRSGSRLSFREGILQRPARSARAEQHHWREGQRRWRSSSKLDAALVKCAGISNRRLNICVVGVRDTGQAAQSKKRRRRPHPSLSGVLARWGRNITLVGSLYPRSVASPASSNREAAKYLHQNDEMWRGLIEAAKRRRRRARGLRSWPTWRGRPRRLGGSLTRICGLLYRKQSRRGRVR